MMTISQFTAIYDRFKSSCLSVRSFCSHEGITATQFYYWQKKLQNDLEGQHDFVPLLLSKPDISSLVPASGLNPHSDTAQGELLSTLAPGCQIIYSNGTRVKFKGCPDINTLQHLLTLNL